MKEEEKGETEREDDRWSRERVKVLPRSAGQREEKRERKRGEKSEEERTRSKKKKKR